VKERTPAQRLAALVALVVLLSVAALSSWWILTDRADFRRLALPPPAEVERSESPVVLP